MTKRYANNENNETELNDDDYVKLKVELTSKGYKVIVSTSYKRYNGSYNIPFNAKYDLGNRWSVNWEGKEREPTLNDFLNRWETDFGITSSKAGNFIRPNTQQHKLRSMVDDNITVNTKLKDLVNVTFDWLNFKPNMTKITNINSLKLNVNVKYKTNTVVNLNKLFDSNDNEFSKMEWCLCNRGWVFCEFPKNMSYKITTSSKLIFNAFKNKDILKELKQICDSFGYIKYKDYKTLFRILTQDMLPIFENEYPKGILDAIYLISETMQIISTNI